MPLALLALAIGAFGIGTTEFVAIGLLPDVATTFGVSIPTAGWMVSAYALGVLIGAPLMMILGTRINRKTMLMLLMGIFVIGNVVSASAPVFGVLIAGRLIASLTHGAFFGIGSVVAAEMVAKEKRAAAIAFMFTGLTLANVVGVPLGTFVGVHAGWRATLWIVAALGVVGLIGVAALVPQLPRPAGVRLGQEVRALGNVQVILAMLMTVLGFGGVFAAITYLAPMMTAVAGFAPSSVSWLLVALGIGMVVGNLVGGKFADKALMPMLYVTLGGLTLALFAFAFTAHSQVLSVVTVLIVGALGFATVPPLQKRVLDQATLAPTLASAINIGAFNLGNALAAWLAGRTIAAGLGYTSANVVGAVMAAGGLGVAVLAGVLEARGRAHSEPTDTTTGPQVREPADSVLG